MTLRLDRRAFLTAMALGACAPYAAARHSDTRHSGTELAWIDATETAARIRRRQISAREAVSAAITRAIRLNPKLEFLVANDFERALQRADGPLSGPFAGVPILIKDQDDLQGLPTRKGSRVTQGAPIARTNSDIAQAFLDAGFIPIGKSATPEFGILPTTEPLAFEATHNPWDLTRSTGGSSGGAAAAVAAGVLPLAHASDGGGSIRIPASCCAVFGLKPSRGRVPGESDSAGFGVHGCVSRSVRDTAAVLAAMEIKGAGVPYRPIGLVSGPGRRRLKIGYRIDTFDGQLPDPAVVIAAQRAIGVCRGLGHHVEELGWPPVLKDFAGAFYTQVAAFLGDVVTTMTQRAGRPLMSKLLEPYTIALGDYFLSLPKGSLESAQATLARCVHDYLALFADYDILLTPVVATPPPVLGWFRGDVPYDVLTERMARYVAYTPIQNAAGNPAMSIPLGWSDTGLPIGTQFAATTGQERVLLELAYELERAAPWARRRPPVAA